MRHEMKNRYRVFRRGWDTYYGGDLITKKQEFLKTRDKKEACQLAAAKNETKVTPAFSLHLARVYWKAGDPVSAKRTWQHVMDEIPKLKQGETKHRRLTNRRPVKNFRSWVRFPFSAKARHAPLPRRQSRSGSGPLFCGPSGATSWPAHRR
jgi:hypothetical protein